MRGTRVGRRGPGRIRVGRTELDLSQAAGPGRQREGKRKSPRNLSEQGIRASVVQLDRVPEWMTSLILTTSGSGCCDTSVLLKGYGNDRRTQLRRWSCPPCTMHPSVAYECPIYPAEPLAGRRFHRIGTDLTVTCQKFPISIVMAVTELAAPQVSVPIGVDSPVGNVIAGGPHGIGLRIVEQPVGMSMNEPSAHTRVIALTRADTGVMEHPPRRGTRLQAGDLAYLVGPYEELLGVLRRARSPGRS